MRAVEQNPPTGRPTAAPVATPLLELLPGVLVKLECNNPGGSHKVRAARHIVQRALDRGEIVPGVTTVIEKTGGNFGFGLAVACRDIGVPVELAVGLGFSPVKRRCLEMFGARLIGIPMLEAGATPREVVEWHLARGKELGRQYHYTDQFNNPASLAAHEFETGPEIAGQLAARDEVTSLTFVSCAGTGACLSGVARALRTAGYDVEVVLVEPAGCDSRNGVFVDHRLEGASVGVAPPMVDWSMVSHAAPVSAEEMAATQREFAARTGYFVGNSSAACLHVAQSLSHRATKTHKILAIIYDHGLWYFKH
ncbi:PLP-dependent cysteine synthase family protein [Azospirillum thermophilum]|uniref:Pyridoxal-5'-phosphate-dependent protein n=1 Tax=Azospirillum thermophilum TaxID=2202148 RepID=A0A2S2CUQ2_9PROT|nr:pyridoxal-phosphate dependent enzyme [Azospirillum thermophilum]AWK88199.1 pyridoxal-5'-phosphate-dependent protein [Azospirillum thermophilum]